MKLFPSAAILLTICLSNQLVTFTIAEDDDVQFVNEWVVHVEDGLAAARSVAAQHGYRMVREVRGIEDHYVLERRDVPHRSKRSAHHHTRRLSDDHRVLYAEQQFEKVRVKREQYDRALTREIASEGKIFDDPKLTNQWYIYSELPTYNRRDSVRVDLKVREVWKMGITGNGTVVTVLDDGLEKENKDIAGNYDPSASYDFNDRDTDPSPRYDVTNENKHGTRCAGEIAMVANNGFCGAGIAFNSKIGGIRMLDGHVTDTLESEALSFNNQYVQIYSASWGPQDDGKTTELPGKMASKAFQNGITKGRGGKGSIYVWASGNGGRFGDNCNSDGYTSLPATISVSSASQHGNSPWYSERCASTLTTTYSSGSSDEGKVVSADLHGKCTASHTGTSAAAPMAAGLVALLLEANPELTWRDVQHIIVHSSTMEPLALEKGWYENAAGYCVNLAFGFGLMSAIDMVELANPETWENVGPQHKCMLDSISLPQELTPGSQIEVEFKTDGCEGQENEVNFLEHIQVIIDLDYGRRGRIYAELESPSGTITPLMLERTYDSSKKGFKNFPLMSTHTWGERPQGTWKFRVADRKSSTDNSLHGALNSATLVFHGTKEQPKHQKENPKSCGGIEAFSKLYSDGSLNTEVLLESIGELLQMKGLSGKEKDKAMQRLETLLNSGDSGKSLQVQNKLQDLLEALQSRTAEEFQNHESEDQELVNAFSKYLNR